jgi:phenylalanyl-tRNA synthetase beta chain
MKVSIKWLKDYIDLKITPSELANRLMMSGNEVKAVITIGEGWNNVVVGQVIAINPHPNADKLRLATVDIGTSQETVVCGAWNYKTGDKIVFATVGAELTDGHSGQKMKLKPAKIRGVESKGMICSEMELGISQEHSGILILPVDAPVGTFLKEYLGDTIIDLDVTPNRPDCLSIIGIAREAAVLTGDQVHINEVKYAESETPLESLINIDIQAPDLCPRYSASLVRGVKVGPSPQWMQDRLVASGMRPINNIVDISNYVMLEYGQPLHTFDYDRIQGHQIVVRRAHDGEQFVSLDGVERKLNSSMLVIADADKAVAIAGVMGGANSEVTEMTSNILLEAASFKATSIHATGEALGLPSEARYRFERGISSGLTIAALHRATQLLADLGGGQAVKGWLDKYPGQKADKPVKLSQIHLQNLMGMSYSMQQINQVLTAMGFGCRPTEVDTEIEVSVPYWRSDIAIEADLIEEVSRIVGYDKIPSTLLADQLPQVNQDPVFTLKNDLSRKLVDYGFSETLSFSLVGKELLNKVSSDGKSMAPAMRVANPMTEDAEFLRTTFRGNLLNAFAANRRYQEGSIRLFESGKVYLPQSKGQPDERETICAVMGGWRYAASWQDKNQNLDFFDAKGVVEGLLMPYALELNFEKSQDGALHPHKQADIFAHKQKIGTIGELHPALLLRFEINEPVFLIELDIKILAELTSGDKNYRPIARFPSVVRDIALIVDSPVSHQSIQKLIQTFPLVEKVEIFDIYEGGQVAAGKKSVAYHISYQSAKNTLTDEEITHVHSQILNRLNSELGAVLRS